MAPRWHDVRDACAYATSNVGLWKRTTGMIDGGDRDLSAEPPA